MIHGQTGRTRHTHTHRANCKVINGYCVIQSVQLPDEKKREKQAWRNVQEQQQVCLCVGCIRTPSDTSQPPNPPQPAVLLFLFPPSFFNPNCIRPFSGGSNFCSLRSKMSSKAQLLHLKPNQPNTTTRIPWTEKKELFFYCSDRAAAQHTHTHKKKGREKGQPSTCIPYGTRV